MSTVPMTDGVEERCVWCGANSNLQQISSPVDGKIGIDYWICPPCDGKHPRENSRRRAIDRIQGEARDELVRVTENANRFVDEVKRATDRAPWTTALERKWEAAAMVDRLYQLNVPGNSRVGWLAEREVLRVADCYSFSGNALEALKAAAPSIPHDSAMRVDLIPGCGQGWWWFSPALPIKTCAQTDVCDALLFSYTTYDQRQLKTGDEADPNQSCIAFTAYVHVDDRVMPSTTWLWKIGETFEEMLRRSRREYRRTYGPMGPLRDVDASQRMGEDATMEQVAYLSLFFLAACAWVEQEIVERSDGHVERHVRKRIQREHRLSEQPTVQVVALRRKHREGTEKQDGVEKREYTCQWVVSGHWRNQAYGPERSQRKLVYVMPYTKGPDGAPLKPQRQKVFAVMR